jgi:hypothetical protein
VRVGTTRSIITESRSPFGRAVTLQAETSEALVWHAIRLLRDRGVHSLDMGGSGDYKGKWGPEPTPVPSCALSRWPVLLTIRRTADQAVRRTKRQPPVPPPFVPGSSPPMQETEPATEM